MTQQKRKENYKKTLVHETSHAAIVIDLHFGEWGGGGGGGQGGWWRAHTWMSWMDMTEQGKVISELTLTITVSTPSGKLYLKY